MFVPEFIIEGSLFWHYVVIPPQNLVHVMFAIATTHLYPT